MADLKTTIRGKSINGTVDTKVATTTTVAPSGYRLPDYFQWRQETFDPYFHLPLNDTPGSTVAKALAGPDSAINAAFGWRDESLVYPYDRYPALEMVGNSRVQNEVRTDFIQNTGTFTLIFWMGGIATGASWVICTTGPEVDDNWGWGFRSQGPNLWRYFFLIKNPDGDGIVATYAFLLTSRTRARLNDNETNHFAIVGDGKRIKMMVNGGVVSASESVDFTPSDVEAPLDLSLFGAARGLNRPANTALQGVIIDDRAWSNDEIKADYLAGAGSLSGFDETRFRLADQYKGTDEYSDLDSPNLVAGYQFQYPEYAGKSVVKQWDTLSASPVLKPGTPVGHVDTIYGQDIPAIQADHFWCREWNGAGIEGLNNYLNIGGTEDFAFLHQVGGRILMELYVDPEDTTRYTLCNTFESSSQTGFTWYYEGNNDRFLLGLTGEPIRNSAALGITEPGFYRFEVVFSQDEVSFYLDGQLVSTEGGFSSLDGSNTSQSTFPLRVGASAFGLVGYRHTISALFVYENGGE